MRGAVLRLLRAVFGPLAITVALTGAAASQSMLDQPLEPTPPGPARRKTCTQLRNECDHRGFIVEEKPAVQAARCARYWDFCMKTGVHHDGKRTIQGVIRE